MSDRFVVSDSLSDIKEDKSICNCTLNKTLLTVKEDTGMCQNTCKKDGYWGSLVCKNTYIRVEVNRPGPSSGIFRKTKL